jgi:hypothetical protein
MYYFKFILFSAYNGNHSWVLERGMDGLIYNVKRLLQVWHRELTKIGVEIKWPNQKGITKSEISSCPKQ